MHPELGVLIHSHQFRCVVGLLEDKLPAGWLQGGGQLRPRLPRAAQQTARNSCKHCDTKPPKRNEPPPPPTSLTADSTTITDFRLLSVQHRCLFVDLWAPYQHDSKQRILTTTWHSQIICVFSGKKAYTIITIRTPQVSLRRACQGNVGLSTALPKPATEALSSLTGSVRCWQSS